MLVFNEKHTHNILEHKMILRSFLMNLKLEKEELMRIIYRGFRIYEPARSIPTTEM